MPKDFMSVLNSTFEKMKGRNPSFSMRAYARYLGISASLLSNLLRGERRPTRMLIEKVAQKLKLPDSQMKDLAQIYDNRKEIQSYKRRVNPPTSCLYENLPARKQKFLNQLLGCTYTILREDGRRFEHEIIFDHYTNCLRVYRDHRGPEYSQSLILIPKKINRRPYEYLHVIRSNGFMDFHTLPLTEALLAGQNVFIGSGGCPTLGFLLRPKSGRLPSK